MDYGFTVNHGMFSCFISRCAVRSPTTVDFDECVFAVVMHSTMLESTVVEREDYDTSWKHGLVKVPVLYSNM
jgi:hypothetical protein